MLHERIERHGRRNKHNEHSGGRGTPATGRARARRRRHDQKNDERYLRSRLLCLLPESSRASDAQEELLDSEYLIPSMTWALSGKINEVKVEM